MYYGLVYFPAIEDEQFHEIRNKYEPYASLLAEHITFIFPVPSSIGVRKLQGHIREVLASWKPFEIHICGTKLMWDHWLMLLVKEGNQKIIDLHAEFYTGILAPHHRKDLPFAPRIALGHFGKQKWDFDNPTAVSELNVEKYEIAKTKIEGISLDYRRKIDRLTLVKLNAQLSKSWNTYEFSLE